MQEEKIIYSDGDTELRGYIIYDPAQGDKKKRPGVIVVHDASGCNDFARSKAKKLAQLGYIAFAVDMYGEGKFASEFSDAMKIS